jgi:hypothetical protein
MFEEAIRGLEANNDPQSPAPHHVRYELLEMYVRNGQPGKALAVARAADARDSDRQPKCEIGANVYAVAEALRKIGRNAAADSAVRPTTLEPPECGFEADVRHLRG